MGNALITSREGLQFNVVSVNSKRTARIGEKKKLRLVFVCKQWVGHLPVNGTTSATPDVPSCLEAKPNLFETGAVLSQESRRRTNQCSSCEKRGDDRAEPRKDCILWARDLRDFRVYFARARGVPVQSVPILDSLFAQYDQHRYPSKYTLLLETLRGFTESSIFYFLALDVRSILKTL